MKKLEKKIKREILDEEKRKAKELEKKEKKERKKREKETQKKREQAEEEYKRMREVEEAEYRKKREEERKKEEENERKQKETNEQPKKVETPPAEESSVVCGGCQLHISGQGLRALNKKWHHECFVCSACKKQLSGSFMHHEGKPYCTEDFQKLFSKVCGGCGKTIDGQFMKAMDKEWHPTGCFVCNNCKGPLTSGFFNKGGKPHCKSCV